MRSTDKHDVINLRTCSQTRNPCRLNLRSTLDATHHVIIHSRAFEQCFHRSIGLVETHASLMHVDAPQNAVLDDPYKEKIQDQWHDSFLHPTAFLLDPMPLTKVNRHHYRLLLPSACWITLNFFSKR